MSSRGLERSRQQAVDGFMERLVRRTPHEEIFHQAVRSVVEDVMPVVLERRELAEAAILERLVEPERIHGFRVAWQDDAGRVQVDRAWRVQWSGALGPFKGGLRFHPSVDLAVLKFLGFEQTVKNALTGLPLGGAKGGADFDPKGRSEREVMRFCQALMTLLHRVIGVDEDIPAGDIGVGQREIGWLFGQYRRLTHRFAGVVTGKGREIGGSLMRVEATGYGLVMFVERMLERRGDGLRGKTCVISGAGNVALHAAERAVACGARVVTLSDSDGFVHDPDGLDADKMAWVKALKLERRGRIREYAERFDVQYREGQAPWGVPCDVALPCATQNELDGGAARRLVDGGCEVVAEGANMPSTAEAVAVFRAAGLLYAPDKAANAGGVAVSALEMGQNAVGLPWSRERVNGTLATLMGDIHARCVEHGCDRGGHVDYARGANVAGFLRVAEAMLAQGVM